MVIINKKGNTLPHIKYNKVWYWTLAQCVNALVYH